MKDALGETLALATRAVHRGGRAPMGSHVARDDLASLFNDDLLGMESGVGDAAAEEKAREALSNSFFQDESRGTPDRAGGRGGGGRETRGYDSPPPPGMHAGGCTPGGGAHDRGRGGNPRPSATKVMPGPRIAGQGGEPGGHGGDRHLSGRGTPHRTPGGRGDGRHGMHDDHDGAHHRGADDDHDDVGRHHRDADEDDYFDSESDDDAARPSPAELLGDARSILRAADEALMRDGCPPSSENMRRLDDELRRIVGQQRTTIEDDQKRQNLLTRFSQMLAKKFPGVSLTPFGSYVSVFHTAGSDIDVSLEVDPSSVWYDAKEMGRPDQSSGPGGQHGKNTGRGGHNRRQQQPPRGYKSRKVQLLSKVASELRYQRFSEVNLIAHARVPLIKFRDPATGVNCDVCVGNDGVYKSAVLGVMANLDERYRDLVFLVKMWAKNFDANDATAGSFNSFALSLMSLFHLQTRSPPILPPVLRLTLQNNAAADADLAHENERANNLEPIRKFPVSKIRQQSDFLRDIEPVETRSARWRGCGAENQASLAELLVTFFTHFRSVEPLWRHGLVASTYAGRWVAGCSWAPGRYCVGVEDPFSAGDNVARAVQRRSLPKVLSAVRDGTLAMARVVWAESDADLERTLFDLLGPGALPPREMPQVGWPTLGGSGANEELNSPGPGMGMTPGRSPGLGQSFRTERSYRASPVPPPGPPPMPPTPVGMNLLNLITGAVGAPGMMMNQMGPVPNSGMSLFGSPRESRVNNVGGPGHNQHGNQGVGHMGGFQGQRLVENDSGRYQQPGGAGPGHDQQGQFAQHQRHPPGGFPPGPGNGQFFQQHPPRPAEALDLAFDRGLRLQGGHGEHQGHAGGTAGFPLEHGTHGTHQSHASGAPPPGFSDSRGNPVGAPPGPAGFPRSSVHAGDEKPGSYFNGRAAEASSRVPPSTGGHTLGESVVGIDLPSPNTSPGGDIDGMGGKRRGRRGTDGTRARGKGRLPVKPESVGPKTLPKPRLASAQ